MKLISFFIALAAILGSTIAVKINGPDIIGWTTKPSTMKYYGIGYDPDKAEREKIDKKEANL